MISKFAAARLCNICIDFMAVLLVLMLVLRGAVLLLSNGLTAVSNDVSHIALKAFRDWFTDLQDFFFLNSEALSQGRLRIRIPVVNTNSSPMSYVALVRKSQLERPCHPLCWAGVPRCILGTAESWPWLGESIRTEQEPASALLHSASSWQLVKITHFTMAKETLTWGLCLWISQS